MVEEGGRDQQPREGCDPLAGQQFTAAAAGRCQRRCAGQQCGQPTANGCCPDTAAHPPLLRVGCPGTRHETNGNESESYPASQWPTNGAQLCRAAGTTGQQGGRGQRPTRPTARRVGVTRAAGDANWRQVRGQPTNTAPIKCKRWGWRAGRATRGTGVFIIGSASVRRPRALSSGAVL